jgi:hypothetical protein
MNIRAVLMVSPLMHLWKIPEFRQEATLASPGNRYEELRSLICSYIKFITPRGALQENASNVVYA